MAQIKHVIKFSAIANFFCEADERKLIARGENAVESNHVKSFHFSAPLRLMKGEIHASMRDRTYVVEVSLDEEWHIQEAKCSCPRGQFLCHHVAAICIYGHHNISVTDVECHWAQKKPKEDVKPINEIYVGKTHKSTNREVTTEEIEAFQLRLQDAGTVVGFSWLLRPEPTAALNILPDIEEFLFSEQYLSAVDKKTCFTDTIAISQEKMVEVSELTVGQFKNENWLVCRKNRLTASNFGPVLAAISRNRYPPSLFKRLTDSYNLEKVQAIQWGVANEVRALAELSETLNETIIPTGLWLAPCGFLGASPDGLVGDTAIVEVKCPFKYRTKDLVKELKQDKTYIIQIDENNEIHINTQHEYYHQIQGNLFICGRNVCHLWIWTPDTNIHVEVTKDDEWSTNVEALKDFYMERYIPYLVGKGFFDE